MGNPSDSFSFLVPMGLSTNQYSNQLRISFFAGYLRLALSCDENCCDVIMGFPNALQSSRSVSDVELGMLQLIFRA